MRMEILFGVMIVGLAGPASKARAADHTMDSLDEVKSLLQN